MEGLANREISGSLLNRTSGAVPWPSCLLSRREPVEAFSRRLCFFLGVSCCLCLTIMRPQLWNTYTPLESLLIHELVLSPTGAEADILLFSTGYSRRS